MLKIYLVGGAVRDQLLGLPVKEKDWVVVGASAADMLQKGFRQVGKDFPVFLHPQTHEEYALARTERKVGLGYTGFDFNASPSVTLEEDLLRRDLTINAIAQTPEGELIDPYHGKEDLDQKWLRHVSPAFVEDPVRILRVARFAARFAALGFVVAPETVALMQQMVASGEVDALVAERVWKELERALVESQPEQFFHVLAQCGALSVLFPMLAVKGSGMAALQQAARESADAEIRWAVLWHDLSAEQITQLCTRYRVPSVYRELALLVAQYYTDYVRAADLNPEQLLALLQGVDAFRRQARFQKFLQACAVIASVTSQISQTQPLLAVYHAASVDVKALLQDNLAGKEIAERIAEKRLAAIAALVGSDKKPKPD